MDSAALSARLRKFRPSRLVAVSSTGEKRNIAVPTGRRRKWDFAIRALEHLDWVTLELLDEAGGIMDIIDNRAGGDEGELVEVTPDAKAAGMLELLLRGQDVALARQERAQAQLIDGYTKLVAMFGDLAASLSRGYSSALAASQRAAEIQADAQPDVGEELIRQFAPGIVGKVMGTTKK